MSSFRVAMPNPNAVNSSMVENELYSLNFDGAFKMSDDLTYGSDSDIPLSLAVEKYYLEKLSGRTGSSSNYWGHLTKLILLTDN